MKQQQIDITSSAHSPGKIIWKLAWPVMLEQILIMMVQYVDTAMVRVVIQHFSKNTVISMVLGHPNSEITCIPPS